MHQTQASHADYCLSILKQETNLVAERINLRTSTVVYLRTLCFDIVLIVNPTNLTGVTWVGPCKAIIIMPAGNAELNPEIMY